MFSLFALTWIQKNLKRRRDRYLLKANLQPRDQLIRCRLPSYLGTTVNSTAWLLILPSTLLPKPRKCSTANLRCITHIPVLEASCLVVILIRIIHLLLLLNPLATFRPIHTNKVLSMVLLVMVLTSPMVSTLRICRMASPPWDRHRLQDTTHVQTAS